MNLRISLLELVLVVVIIGSIVGNIMLARQVVRVARANVEIRKTHERLGLCLEFLMYKGNLRWN